MKKWLLAFMCGAIFSFIVGVLVDFRPMLAWVADRAAYVAVIMLIFLLLAIILFLQRRRIEDVVSAHIQARIDYYTDPMLKALAESTQNRPSNALQAWAEFSSRAFNLIQIRFFIVLSLSLIAGVVGTISVALLNQQNTLLAKRWVAEGRPAALEALYKTENICRSLSSGKVA